MSPSAFFTPVMAEAFAVDLSRRRDSVVETGYPRNDALYRYTAGQIAEIRERLGIPDGEGDPLRADLARPVYRLSRAEPAPNLSARLRFN